MKVIVRRCTGLPSVVYHLAEAANWESIQRRGLQSASALLDLADLPKSERNRLATTCRLTHTRLPSGAEIRDQRPMPAKALERCLVGTGRFTAEEFIQHSAFRAF